MDIRDKIADAFAIVDGLVEDVASAYRNRILTLLNEQGERNEAIWQGAEAPIGVTVDMLAKVPISQRIASDDWNQQFAAIIAASKRQAWLELIANPLFAEAGKYSGRVKSAAKTMSKSDLKQAAKDGVSKESFDSARRARMERTVSA